MFVCICISKMSNLRLHCLYRWLQFAFGQEEQRPPRESITLSPPSTQPPKGKPLKSSGDMGNVNEDRMYYFLLTMLIPGTWEPQAETVESTASRMEEKQSWKNKESNVIEKWKEEDHEFKVSHTEPELRDTLFQNKENRRKVNQHSDTHLPF